MVRYVRERHLRMESALGLVLTLLLLAPATAIAQAGSVDVPRMPDGRPDLSGTYDAATLTPLQRPPELGDKLTLTDEEAAEIAEQMRRRRELENRPTNPNRGAPPEGGVDETLGGNEASGAAGRVGGYNNFWVDPGDGAFKIDGKWRTSIIVDPENGRYPPRVARPNAPGASGRSLRRPNDGTAYWLESDGPGPYDGPESLGISERCILGFTGAAPTFPSLYNNFKRIVQAEDHVMILVEMVHDARIVRLNSEHPPADQRFWLGDSIGWWEGDTLVVDTTNFHPEAAPRGGSENMHLVERFTKLPEGDVVYRFTVDDPTVWTAPWTGEYLWRTSDEQVYEYACHEGNYAMEGILKGARLLEAEWLEKNTAKKADSDSDH
ncbi:MAG TPA: hypothetical protein VMT85_24600 [Thermoanaerobaculia bacterium]|nr:hypothetical protein [Thermoanaerobaculia bacterium]